MAGQAVTVSSAPRRASARERFTFHGNLRDTRHGWLRLTPAYSVQWVREQLEECRGARLPILDPFCGTGTTLLACAELGIDCDAIDINPFLVWLARAKTGRYDRRAVEDAARCVRAMARATAGVRAPEPWIPALYRIDRWWQREVLLGLGRAFAVAAKRFAELGPRAQDLVKLSFCRALIATANVSFGHQSMSFRRGDGVRRTGSEVAQALESAFSELADAAAAAAAARAAQRRVWGFTAARRAACRQALQQGDHIAAVSQPHELHPRAQALHVLARLPRRAQ